MFMSRRTLPYFLIVLLLQVSIASAQPGGRRGGSLTIDRALALGIPQVRSELKLTDDQAATIDAAIQAYQQERQESQPDRGAFSFLTPEEQEEVRAEAAQAAKVLSGKTDEMLDALLEPAQAKRLGEMILQAQLQLTPADALRNNLELSEEQQKQLKDLEAAAKKQQEEMTNSIREKMLSGQRPNFLEIRKTIEDAQKKARADAMGLVTDAQEEKLVAMQGAKFEIDLMSLMQRGGPRGRRGRGRSGPGGSSARQRPQAEDSE